MHKLLFVFFAFVMSFGLEIQTNFGKEKNESFSVLNLKHDEEFECKEEFNVYNEVIMVVCTIETIPSTNFAPIDTFFFKVSTKIEKEKLVINIAPKKKEKLFSTFIDPTINMPIPKERPKKSKSWQVVGYNNEIPFLSKDTKSNGINFPIEVTSINELYIDQIGIGRKPISYKANQDFIYYKEIKKMFQDKQYNDVIVTTEKALKLFPNSIFEKDFLFYRIESLYVAGQNEGKLLLITEAQKWIKQYPSEPNAPKVLYMLSNTFIDLKLYNDAIHNFKRIISEYPSSKYLSLAKMELAKNFALSGRDNITSAYFAKAYTQAKDINIASEVAMEWGVYNIKIHKPNDASRIFNKVMDTNPKYLLHNAKKTYEIIKELAEAGMYKDSATIGAFLVRNMDDVSSMRRDIINDVGIWYEKANILKNANFFNELFLKEYPKTSLWNVVKQRNDKLIFALNQDSPADEKLKKYDYIIKEYPNTQHALKAMGLKAEILLELGRGDEVISMQQNLGKDSELIVKAYNQQIIKNLETDCKKASLYAIEANKITISNSQKLKLFDCLYSMSAFKDALKLTNIDKNKAPALEWIYREAKALFNVGDFKKSLQASRDALSIAKSKNEKQYYDIEFFILKNLIQLDSRESTIKMFAQVQKSFPDDERILEPESSLLKWAQEAKDYTLVQIYANDIIRVQRLVNKYEYSPYVDFALIQALINQKEYEKSLAKTEEILSSNVDDQTKQKALYTQASIYKTMGKQNEAKDSFGKCVNINTQSIWKDLCAKALKLD